MIGAGVREGAAGTSEVSHLFATLSADAALTHKDVAMGATVSLRIDDMTCAAGVSRIERARPADAELDITASELHRGEIVVARPDERFAAGGTMASSSLAVLPSSPRLSRWRPSGGPFVVPHAPQA